MEEELAKYKKHLATLQSEVEWYQKLYPEVTIFYRKVAFSEYLLKISLEDLQNAPKQPWYEEYLALLAIRLDNTPLRSMCRQTVNDLLQWYKDSVEKNECNLAVLGMIQLIDPKDLPIPFNQHLWHKKMIADVQGVLLNHYTDFSYTNDEIAAYYLARQSMWRYENRKMRVVFIVQSHVSCDKVLPVYEEMRRRNDIEVTLLIHAEENYKYSYSWWAYFYNRYPNARIYDYGLIDLQKLRPDYVFLTNPYENKRVYPGFRANDIVKHAKICILSYGASLAYVFVNRQIRDYLPFWQNVYMIFCSSQDVKTEVIKKFPQDVNMGYKHIEFLGYPVLNDYYMLKKEPGTTTRILWTPRWNIEHTIGGSHFLDYKDNIIAFSQKYGEKISLYFRPHPNLFGYLVEMELMTEKEIEQYEDLLRENKIVFDTSNYSDMAEHIANIDIFLTDYSSIMIEFFLTGRPIIYCEFSYAVPLPEFEEMFAAMYIAHSWEEAENYLDDLIAGNDPLFEKRQEIAKKIHEQHVGAAQRIVDRVIKDFNQNIVR